MHIATLLAALFAHIPASTPEAPPPAAVAVVAAPFVRPVNTYSIVARDAATGEMGVAVQSNWFSVGSVVPWARAGVGAVATQAIADVSYGPRGLERMASNVSAPDALAQLVSADEGRDVIQVAFIDTQGRAGVHTGDKCIDHAGHHTGTAPDGSTYSVQANLMRSPDVPEAMSIAFETADKGTPLAERLVRALHAAEEAGGDVRGKQSAALLVVSAERSDREWEGRSVELRIEDHPDPLAELERLLKIRRAVDALSAGDEALKKGDLAAAIASYDRARELAPHDPQMVFWAGASLAAAGQIDEARKRLLEAFKDTKGDWKETLRRLPKSGLFPNDPALMTDLLRE